ncbi:MAG: 1,4-alpha-glucan branching protein GlgB [Candidatus Magnetobacterium sp. LHC-1]|nr:1,4-alpha-glucan branching protein GlgB [Nitrospirota bacterium]
MNLNEHIDQVINATSSDPFSVLGMHHIKFNDKDAIAIRVFNPDAKELYIVRTDATKKVYQATRLRQEGFFETIVEQTNVFFPYKVRIISDAGTTEVYDPYSFEPVLSDFDLHLMSEGTHYKKYEKLGAHVTTINGITGVFFAVWAPNALRVSVIGDFNNWDGRRHQMRLRGSFGVWELFVPSLQEGDIYKFELKGRYGNYLGTKSDPYGFFAEVRPKSASVVYDINKYKWKDDAWMNNRRKRNWLEAPVSTYEVHLGSWRRVPEDGNRWLTYRELAETLIPYVKDLGYTHIELLPITEHPLDASWGYQPVGYFACTSRHGTPDDFMYFVDKCHENNIGVIMDWVPAHFPRDSHGLSYFDGTALYEHADWRKGEHKEWGTLIFNYGRNEVANFLIANALFWLDKYHLDGLRVDAVASMLYLDYSKKHGEWLPNKYGGKENIEAIDLLRRFNEVLHGYHPGILTIAEESTSWPMVSRPTYLGGLGFSLKWNMGWMHDMLLYFQKEPVHRKYHHNNLTFALLYAFTENFVNVFSHDEVVHLKRSMLDKMPGDMWQKFANLKTLYAYMYAQPGKKLLFMGSEFGQWKEWNVDISLDWHLTEHEPHRKLMDFVRDLNNIYKTERAFYEVDFDHQGFEWIDFGDYANSIVSFIRKAKDPEDFIVCVFNFTPVARTNYRVGVPKGGFYKELLNSDSERFWGSNVGNWGGFHADHVWWQGRPFSLNLQVPPLGAVFMKPYSDEVITIAAEEIKEQEAKEREQQVVKEAKEQQTAKELAVEKPVTLKTEPAEKTVKIQTKPEDKK